MTRTPFGCRNEKRETTIVVLPPLAIFHTRIAFHARRRCSAAAVALSPSPPVPWIPTHLQAADIRRMMCICGDGYRMPCDRRLMHTSTHWRKPKLYIIIAYFIWECFVLNKTASCFTQPLLPMVTVAHFFHLLFGRGNRTHTDTDMCVLRPDSLACTSQRVRQLAFTRSTIDDALASEPATNDTAFSRCTFSVS